MVPSKPLVTFGRFMPPAARSIDLHTWMAGSPDNVFIVGIQPWTLTARLYPGARWRGTNGSQGGAPVVDMRPVGLGEKLAATGALGLPLAVAFWPKRRGAMMAMADGADNEAGVAGPCRI